MYNVVFYLTIVNKILRHFRSWLVRQYLYSSLFQTKGKQSQLKCTYVEERKQGMFTKPSKQAEIINFDPLIVIFHNFTNSTMQKNFSQSGLNAVNI